MENLKIKVNSEAESKEAQELFFELGYRWAASGSKASYLDNKIIHAWSDGYLTVCDLEYTDFSEFKEITLPELRAIVSLHKNPINMDKILSEVRSDALGLLEDKEYLNKETYEFVRSSSELNDMWIEIPEWADCYAVNNGHHMFFSNIDLTFEWSVLWQRAKQPEELPFVDDELSFEKHVETMKSLMTPCMPKPPLNDQYAEIEQVRQNTVQNTLNERESTYGSFTGVANTTGQLMGVLLNSKNGQTLPYVHQEALHMICSKMARIVNGDHNHKDSWHDIAGYATLVERLL